ncbi:MAG: hypothetical protein JWO15_488, partial [Sphingomonadales bacterium]|nr:hypothetical protein [Sphingomonadales bacterium]
MSLAYFKEWFDRQSVEDWRHQKLSHRAIALALAILIEALFLLMLLQIVPSPFSKKIAPALVTFDVMPSET